MNKPEFDDIFMQLAVNLAKRSHCIKRHVGAVLTKDTRIISSEWIDDALHPYSFDLYGREIFDYFEQLNLGYMNWFSAKSGNYTVYFSWGHGGQHIFLLHELNMIIVTTADYMPGQDGDEAWKKQKSITDMVGKYISKLP